VTKRRLERIEKAAKLAAEIFREIAKHIKPGISEADLAAKIESRIKVRGFKSSFKTIVASGSNAAKPHAALTQRKISVATLSWWISEWFTRESVQT